MDHVVLFGDMQRFKDALLVFQGDSLHCTTEVISKRESKSRPDAGIVEFEHKAFNQHDALVAVCRRQAFMRKTAGGA